MAVRGYTPGGTVIWGGTVATPLKSVTAVTVCEGTGPASAPASRFVRPSPVSVKRIVAPVSGRVGRVSRRAVAVNVGASPQLTLAGATRVNWSGSASTLTSIGHDENAVPPV